MAFIDYLAKSSLFHGLPEEYLNWLTPCCREKFFQQHHQLFKEGDVADTLYVITSGQVVLEMTVTSSLRHFKETIAITSVGPPHPIAERALVAPYRYAFSARAVLDTSCVAIDCVGLRERMDSDHYLGSVIRKNLLQILSERLQQTREVLAYERATRLI